MDLLDTRAGLALANAAWTEGASTMPRSVNTYHDGPWTKPTSPYSPALLARIRADQDHVRIHTAERTVTICRQENLDG